MINYKEMNTVSNYVSLLRLLLAVPFWLLLDNFYEENVRYYIFALCLFASPTPIYLTGIFSFEDI